MKNLTLLFHFFIVLLFTQNIQAQTAKPSRLKFWIRPVFVGNSAIDETNEHQVNILADQFDAYFRYVKELDCFEVVVDLNSSEPLEKDTARPEFELTISFNDNHYYYRTYPAVCIVSDSLVRIIENKLVTVAWSLQSKPVRSKNPYLRHASIAPYVTAGINRDSFYCAIPVVEDSLSKQSTFPTLVEFAAMGNGPACDTPLCKPESSIEKLKDEKRSYYRIQQPQLNGQSTCCWGSNAQYAHGYIQLPVGNESTTIEIIKPDKSKTTVPVKMKKIRTRLPEWRIIH